MPMPTLSSTGHRRPTTASPEETPDAQRTRWGRFLNALLPEPSPERLVHVTDMSRTMVPFAEESLADAEIHAVVQELPTFHGAVTFHGATTFRILVAARDRDLAAEALAGL